MKESGQGAAPPNGELSPEEIAEFRRRADELGRKLGGSKAEKQAEIEAQEDRSRHSRGMALGLKMSTELVAAILVGGFIGWMLDYWLVITKPWLFLVFLILGFAAGVLNVVRGFQRIQAEIARETGGDIGHAIPDDRNED